MTSNSPRSSTLRGRAVVAALKRLRCVESRKSEAGFFYRTPRGKSLPPILLDREVHMNTLTKVKRILEAEHLDLMAALEGAIKDDRQLLSDCPHKERGIAGTRWACLKCGSDLGPAPEKVTSKAPLAASIGERVAMHVPSGLGTAPQAFKTTLAPAPATPPPAQALRIVPSAPLPSTLPKQQQQPASPAAVPSAEETSMPRPYWSKYPPEFKLEHVRRTLAEMDRGGTKGNAIAKVALASGLSFHEYYSWALLLKKAGYDLSKPLPDDAAKVFDTRIDPKAHGRATAKGQRERLKRMAKKGFCTIESAAKACGMGTWNLRNKYLDTGILPRVDSEFGLVVRLADVAKVKVMEEERKAGMKKNGTSEVVEVTPDAILAEVDALMKRGDVEALAEMLEARGLKMSDVKRLKQEAAAPKKPVDVEERLERLEKMLAKLVKSLGD